MWQINYPFPLTDLHQNQQALSPLPVSYTHLDVYKRQLLDRAVLIDFVHFLEFSFLNVLNIYVCYIINSGNIRFGILQLFLRILETYRLVLTIRFYLSLIHIFLSFALGNTLVKT